MASRNQRSTFYSTAAAFPMAIPRAIETPADDARSDDTEWGDLARMIIAGGAWAFPFWATSFAAYAAGKSEYILVTANIGNGLMVAGSLTWRLFTTIERIRRVNRMTFNPPASRPPLPESGLVRTTGEETHHRQYALLPDGWTLAELERFAAAVVDNDYDLAGRNYYGDGKPFGQTQYGEMMNWLEGKGYGSRDARRKLILNVAGHRRINAWARGEMSVI